MIIELWIQLRLAKEPHVVFLVSVQRNENIYLGRYVDRYMGKTKTDCNSLSSIDISGIKCFHGRFNFIK